MSDKIVIGKKLETKEQETKKVDKKESTSSFDDWINDLEEAPQPTCNIENPEDCEACGS
jgi:hypothetical protein